ncbi:DUF1707 SHOCT-like domain-containing protein [Brevibacterium oceani]|uniref:DUF1707 SHOCT-like domain-containing protein n=1 Tax=Brevibacterium oceani TaxID=358099 RepID=UPI00215A063A|nr:DUF1707 domain-containing protein [Brevibacterium oceani]
MRPSFAERDAYRSALSQAFADGRIEEGEFSRRSILVETGQSADELRRALADLPQPEVEFPSTVTRAEALDRSRRRQAPGGKKYGRRALLAGGAAALGFVVAGGIGQLVGGNPGSANAAGDSDDGDDSDDGGDTRSAGDFVYDPAALGAVLQKIKDKGYTHFMSIDIYPDTFQAAARSLKSMSGIDAITDYGDGKLEINATGHLPQDIDLFTLDDFALDLIPAMARAAQKKIGGKNGLHVMLNMGPGQVDDKSEPLISVYVEGGDYGVGTGEVVWTGDGKQLDSVHRADED